MGIKKYKASTPGKRWATGLTFDEITRTRPEKSLTRPLAKTGGRNRRGRKTVGSKGGGHKRCYRVVDFRYSKKGMSAVVESIEYDPNRSANIALVRYEDGEKAYVIAPAGLRIGASLMCGSGARIETGNSTELKNIPMGMMVYCIELEPGRGAKIARSAGMGAMVAAKDENRVYLRMPSGEIRLVGGDCYASIGKVGNIDHQAVLLGKAGRARYLGRRPASRAVVKNPVDHPMGGGEGKSSGGRHPSTPWGKITKGLKTRKRKASDAKIITRRKKKRKKT